MWSFCPLNFHDDYWYTGRWYQQNRTVIPKNKTMSSSFHYATSLKTPLSAVFKDFFVGLVRMLAMQWTMPLTHIDAVKPTGAVPVMKPEATAIGDPQDGCWKITLMLDGRRFCILKFRSSTLQQTTHQWRHWWFPTTSCFGVTNHGRLALLWLVTQDRATINSGSPPSCDVTFWQ